MSTENHFLVINASLSGGLPLLVMTYEILTALALITGCQSCLNALALAG